VVLSVLQDLVVPEVLETLLDPLVLYLQYHLLDLLVLGILLVLVVLCLPQTLEVLGILLVLLALYLQYHLVVL
jgi:hypothetical protein